MARINGICESDLKEMLVKFMDYCEGYDFNCRSEEFKRSVADDFVSILPIYDGLSTFLDALSIIPKYLKYYSITKECIYLFFDRSKTDPIYNDLSFEIGEIINRFGCDVKYMSLDFYEAYPHYSYEYKGAITMKPNNEEEPEFKGETTI